MIRSLVATIVMAAVILVAFNAWLWLQQASMLFFPLSDMSANPTDWGMEYEDVTLHTEDGVTLYGWYIPGSSAKRALLFFHGNAGNISHRSESLKIFHHLGVNVLIIDYRGYGRSLGRPSEEGLHADAVAAWRYLSQTKHFDASQIVLFGRSLGGAVAARLATEVKPAALILESTFSSARDVAAVHYPILSKLIVMRFSFNTAARVKEISCPVLVVHSPDDQIIPYYLGEKVYQAAKEPKFMLRLQGGHNAGFLQSQPAYERGIAEFISRYVNKPEVDAGNVTRKQSVSLIRTVQG